MATLVVGASGATGKLLVEELIKAGGKIKVIVRESSIIPETWYTEQVTIYKLGLLERSAEEVAVLLTDCHAIVSCLGHSMTWQGIYGKPRRLVTDSVKLLCEAVGNRKTDKPLKFVLMNTTGNRNRDLAEPVSPGEKILIGLMRLLLPPHPDNEKAADYLRVKIGQANPHIEWVAVRPDNLINDEKVSEYSLHASPIRSAIFNPGKTSRINVANFMARLLLNDELWEKWKGQMPVIYNEN